MKRSILSIIAWCVLVGALAIPGPAMAEKGRTLGGYRFVPMSNIKDPFIVTRFDSYTGIATASDVEFPVIVIPTEPPDTLLSLNGNFLFVVAQFNFSYAVHPRVMLSLDAGGASRVGTSGQALISQGVTALKVVGVGAVVELWRNDRFLVSGMLDVGFADGIVIDFIQFVEEILDGNVENPSIINEIDGGTVDGGFSAALALNEWAGITGTGQIGAADVEGISDELRWRVTVAGSVDFGQRGNAPVSLALEFDADRLKPGTMGTSTSVGLGLGVYYTGREDLNLGVEIRGSRLPLQNWDTVAYPKSYGLAVIYFF
jgi:hypothetical protein